MKGLLWRAMQPRRSFIVFQCAARAAFVPHPPAWKLTKEWRTRCTAFKQCPTSLHNHVPSSAGTEQERSRDGAVSDYTAEPLRAEEM